MTEKSENVRIITEERLIAVCKINQGEDACRFAMSNFNGTRHFCYKGTDSESKILHQIRIRAKIETGDNCSGPPDFTLNTN